MSYWNMTARGNLSSVYSITDNTRCKSRTVTTPSGPLEVPELSCEPGRQKQKRLGLFLSLRRRYKLKSVMAKYAFNSFIKQLSLKRSNTTSLLLFFLSSHQENVSFCARQGAQSGPLPAVLYRDGRHARGLQTLQVSADFFFYSCCCCFLLLTRAFLHAGMCTTARSGWWLETRITPASRRGSTCTRTPRAQERRGCVRSSALIESSSPTTRWTIRDM